MNGWLACCRTAIVSSGEMHGVITSPNHPAPYGDNLEMRWIINVPEGYNVRLILTEFDLESGTGVCEEDYVMVSLIWVHIFGIFITDHIMSYFHSE